MKTESIRNWKELSNDFFFLLRSLNARLYDNSFFSPTLYVRRMGRDKEVSDKMGIVT